MSRNQILPYFAVPPKEYDQTYFADLTRSFATYMQQQQNPGEQRATTITLTDLPTYADNASAISGGLAVNDVYKTATGELRIVV